MSIISQMQLTSNRVLNTYGVPKLGLVSSSVVQGATISIKVRLMPEDIEVGPMPYFVPWAGADHGFLVAPAIGDQVQVLFHEADKNCPLGGQSTFWNEAAVPDDFEVGQALWFDSSGAFIKLNNDGTITVSPNASGRILIPGNLAITTVGKGLQIKEGANAKASIVTLNAGIVTVSNTSVTANSRIELTRQGVGIASTQIGALGIATTTVGVSFVINSYLNNASVATGDNSIVYYNIIEPA